MAIDPSKVKRFEHGSRVPGWDEAADLTKDPAVVPDPASTPVPEPIRRDVELLQPARRKRQDPHDLPAVDGDPDLVVRDEALPDPGTHLLVRVREGKRIGRVE